MHGDSSGVTPALKRRVDLAQKFTTTEFIYSVQVTSQNLQSSWDAMCQDVKGKSASEILIDLEVVMGVENLM